MSEKNTKAWKADINKKEDSVVEINGEISWETLSGFKALALENLKKDVEIDGFRKGQAPDKVVLERVGDMAVLGEASNLALQEVYPEIIKEHKLHIIGQPAISVTKMAPENPLGFTITLTVMPEIDLGDYKTIAKKHNTDQAEPEISEEEFQASIDRIRGMGVDHSDHDHKEGEEHDHELPELDLEMVKKFGDFESVEDFKKTMREQMMSQKKEDMLVKRREAMLKEIIADSTFDVPDLLVEVELDKMLAQMKDDIERMGLKYEDYLKHVGKEESEIKKEWHDEAKLRAQSELVLKEIARSEDIKVPEKSLEEQVEKIKAIHKDVPEENIRLFIESNMINQEVLGFLDKQ